MSAAPYIETRDEVRRVDNRSSFGGRIAMKEGFGEFLGRCPASYVYEIWSASAGIIHFIDYGMRDK